jgi:hypothetical protein
MLLRPRFSFLSRFPIPPGQHYLYCDFERFFNLTGPTFSTMAQLFQKGFAPAQFM